MLVILEIFDSSWSKFEEILADVSVTVKEVTLELFRVDNKLPIITPLTARVYVPVMSAKTEESFAYCV